MMSTSVTDLDFAAGVLRQEAQAIDIMASGLDSSFTDAIDCLFSIKGRVVVTGMGKSGHVGRKVAATLASTGTPSFFIHPAEASHGDLGMMTLKDAILAFSNSGNTGELSDIILYACRRNIPIIGVTRNKDSLLGSHANHCLLLPSLPEADPLDCAPTTSTTLQLAIGDALALTLMRKHGYTSDVFHRYHPGGSLGRKLMTVHEIMHTDESLPLAKITDNMTEVLMTMTGKGFGVAGICDAGKLVGIITDGDLRRHMTKNLFNKKAFEVMHATPLVVTAQTLAVVALRTMQENKITSLFVVEDERPLGIFNIHDCLRAGLE